MQLASELLTRQNRHYITSCITTPMAGHAQRNVNACVKIIAVRKVRIIHLYMYNKRIKYGNKILL